MTTSYPKLEARIKPEDFYRELTDPQTHDTNHFCYIVHALNPCGKLGLMLATIRNGGYDFRQEIDLLYEPERITEKLLISSSIINQDHTATFDDTFFILNVPWTNFVKLSPEDCATNVASPQFVLENARLPYTTPPELIRQTKFIGGDSGYNEVVVTGNKEGNLVEIIGVGIKYTDVGDTKLKEPKEAERMRDIARDMNVPVIEMIKQSRIEDSKAEIMHSYGKSRYVREVIINREGYRYIFAGNWDVTQLKDVFKGDKNFCGGYNPVSKQEYLTLRPDIRQGLSTTDDLLFLKQIDGGFGLKFPNLEKQG